MLSSMVSVTAGRMDEDTALERVSDAAYILGAGRGMFGPSLVARLAPAEQCLLSWVPGVKRLLHK